MTIIHGLLLGLLQGIAEFLPISSSGHLALMKHLFGIDSKIDAGSLLLFDVFLHLATLCAVCLYYRKIIASLFCALFRWILRKNVDSEPASETEVNGFSLACSETVRRNTIVMVIISTFFTGIIGVFISKLLPELSVRFVCTGFLITACLLILSAVWERKHMKNSEEERKITVFQAVFIGIVQGLGTLPGISRSGSTISGSLFCGIDRERAGDYSFLISIPAILGAFLLEVKDIGDVSESVGLLPLIVGCLVAFVSGYFSLALLMKIVKKGKLEYFSAYLIPVGILGLIFL